MARVHPGEGIRSPANAFWKPVAHPRARVRNQERLSRPRDNWRGLHLVEGGPPILVAGLGFAV